MSAGDCHCGGRGLPDPHRCGAARCAHRGALLDLHGQPVEVGGQCGLYVDLQPDAAAPMAGDWVATPAGSRYLVDSVRLVKSRRHAQVKRYQLRVLRLPKHTDPPADAGVLWLRWYPRATRTP